jgi:hypothetical protein
MKIIAPVVLIFILLATAGCAKKPPTKTKEQVMQEKLQERLERWHVDLARNCNNRVLERASAIVDSTLLADARFRRDTSDLPSIPGRPDRPDFVPPKDSLPIKPIIKTAADSLD